MKTYNVYVCFKVEADDIGGAEEKMGWWIGSQKWPVDLQPGGVTGDTEEVPEDDMDEGCDEDNDPLAHRRNPVFCAKCGGECAYDDDGTPVNNER